MMEGELKLKLDLAILANEVEEARRLLAQNADINEMLKDYSPFYNAVRKGRFEMVALCAPYVEKFCLDNALSRAATHGHDSIVALLISLHADVHYQNEKSLRCAVEGCHPSTVRLLIQHDADVFHAGIAVFYEARNLADSPQKEEILGTMVGAAMEKGCDRESIVQLHEYYLGRTETLNSLAPAARHGELLTNGTPTGLLRALAGAKLLPLLFATHAWHRREDARNLHRAIREALPEYREQINGIDMTAFAPEIAGGMVSKIRMRDDKPLPVGRR